MIPPPTLLILSLCSGSQGYCLHCPACLVQFQGEVVFAPLSATLEQILRTLLIFKSLVKIECTDPMLTLISSCSSRTVRRQSSVTKVRTCSIAFSFWLVDGL